MTTTKQDNSTELIESTLQTDEIPHETPVDSKVTILKPEKQAYSWLKPTQFKPGESGNPAGRPKKEVCVTSYLKEYLDQHGKDGKTNAQILAEAMFKNALRDPQTLREVLNRCEGKVTENIDIQGTQVSITYELAKKKEE